MLRHELYHTLAALHPCTPCKVIRAKRDIAVLPCNVILSEARHSRAAIQCHPERSETLAKPMARAVEGPHARRHHH